MSEDEPKEFAKQALADLQDETDRRFRAVWNRLDSLEHRSSGNFMDGEYEGLVIKGVIIAVAVYLGWSMLQMLVKPKTGVTT